MTKWTLTNLYPRAYFTSISLDFFISVYLTSSFTHTCIHAFAFAYTQSQIYTRIHSVKIRIQPYYTHTFVELTSANLVNCWFDCNQRKWSINSSTEKNATLKQVSNLWVLIGWSFGPNYTLSGSNYIITKCLHCWHSVGKL